MLHEIFIRPVFNLLLAIVSVVPGNDFGVAVIVLTVIVRVIIWPLARKQLHHQKAIKELQPEVAKIKKNSKGDKQAEAAAMMALYKEREVNPLAPIGLLIVQLPILLTLFQVFRQIVQDDQIAKEAYSFVADLGYIKEIIAGAMSFNTQFIGVFDLAMPNVVLALLAGLGQYVQTKQLAPTDDNAKTLRELLRDAKEGKQAEAGDQQAAMTKSLTTIFPVFTALISLSLPSALALYWFSSSLFAIFQQRIILNKEVEELDDYKAEHPGRPKKSAKARAKTAKKAKVTSKVIRPSEGTGGSKAKSKKKKGRSKK